MKISVALCTYNGAKYLTPQLESILGQTHPPDEILIGDDGSQDDTIAIVQALAQQHPTIRLIQNPTNLGVVKNFENTIQQASGDVIFLCDQDDVWLPERIATMMQPFEQNPEISMVYSQFTFADHKLQPAAVSHFRDEMYVRGIPRQPRRIIQTWGMIFGCTMAIRATLKPFLFPIPAGWEHDNWIGLMAYILGEVGRIELPLMYYRLHQGSSSGNLKHNVSPAQEVRINIGMSKLKFYTEERIRWQNLVERLKEIQATAHLPFLEAFLPEAQRRSHMATRREQMRQGRHVGRIAPALKMLLRGDYHRYMRGLKTFAKDVLIP